MTGQTVFLRAIDLTKEYRFRSATMDGMKARRVAVNRVSLEIMAGECLALVGESGSGKTTFGRCIIRLIGADRGSVVHRGMDLLKLSEKEFRPFRKKFQMIFQESAQALNPRQTVGNCLAEALKVCGKSSQNELSNQVDELLGRVGLTDDLRLRYAHQLSGGQRQRVSIARALAVRPTFLVADEPTSSLDASIKRQIIGLLRSLQHQLGLTMLLISHDMAMVSRVSEQIAVMYKGELVELAPTNLLMEEPAHPYSKLLMEAARSRIDLAPSHRYAEAPKHPMATSATVGCNYSVRCPWAVARCFSEKPPLARIAEGHSVACHLAGKFNSKFSFAEQDVIPNSVICE